MESSFSQLNVEHCELLVRVLAWLYFACHVSSSGGCTTERTRESPSQARRTRVGARAVQTTV